MSHKLPVISGEDRVKFLLKQIHPVDTIDR